MALSTRPGDLLAGRYRLIDLLSESGGGRFWRAHDRVLERYVALHVLAEDDDRAPGLIAAAQASATVLDARILRVLDAETRDGLCYVVNEWGNGTSLDLLLANNGPIGPRRSAWLVADVAGAIDRAHRAGVAHGRLNPENVLIDRFGAVRLIGFCVDAALHGLPGDRFHTDLGDLGGLLYSALTGTWPGPSSSLVPAAPRSADEILSPRQVRAGVPKPLDELWRATAEAADPQLRRRHWVRRNPVTTISLDVSTARAIEEALDEFLGDPTGLTEALATTVLPINQIRPLDLPAITDPMVDDVDPDPPAVVDPPAEVEPAEDEEVDEEAALQPSPDHREPDDSIPLVSELPTEPGLPVFGDDDEVEWLRTRSSPPPPPPPFEEPPERPLFAPDPPDGQPVRRPRDDVPPPPEAHHPLDRPVPTGEIAGYWPWDHDAELERAATDDDAMPGRSWLRLGLGVLVALLLLFAIAIAFNLGRGRDAFGGKPSSGNSTTSTPTTPSAAPLTGLRPTGFDPIRGTDANTAEAGRAVDGDPATTWSTATYYQQLGGKKSLTRGVGLLIDLGAQHTVTDVTVRLAGVPTTIQLYVDAQRPATAPTGRPAASGTATGQSLDLAPTTPVTGQYVVVWLTHLPAVPGGYRGTIAEVVVRGE